MESKIDLSDIVLQKGKRKLFRAAHTFDLQKWQENDKSKATKLPYIPDAKALHNAHNINQALHISQNNVSNIALHTTLDTIKTDSSNTAKASKSELGLKDLRNSFIMMFVILLLCLPKVFLSSHIYYVSKEIAGLQTEYDILVDENRRLKHEYERYRYRMIIGK